MYNKHYIRLNQNGYVIHGFSDAFEQPLETDICINEQGGRHFEIMGESNPALMSMNQCYLYKYKNGKVWVTPPEELAEQQAALPPAPPTEIELIRQEMEIGLVDLDFRQCVLELGL